MKKRVVSIELLRILAMMMVVMLHYLGKGELLPPLTGELDVNGYVAWVLESLSIVAVNVYMLISGYFLIKSEFKVKRLIELICQILFYTIVIEVVLVAGGILPGETLSINRFLQIIFPLQMEHYWFMTAYIIMYLFSPLLSVAVRHMEQKQLRNTIIALLLFFSISKSLLPFQLTIDHKGYDGMWFICVFLVAAYIRLYGLPFLGKGSCRGWICYLVSGSGIFIVTMLIRLVYLKTGSLDHFIGAAFHYNHILNLLAAVGLFYGFLNMKISKESMFFKIVCNIAPYSLGVYLLHEQIALRNLWPFWLGASREGNILLFVVRCILAVLIVYGLGTLVDFGRNRLFRFISKRIIYGFRLQEKGENK